jgi:hypothetical protein
MPSIRALSSSGAGLHALIDIEEHHEEHQGDAERDLGPDAEPEPQREDRRQHHTRQRIHHLDVGIEDRGDGLLAREPESDQRARQRADHECQHRFRQRYQQMPPDGAFDQPFGDAVEDIDRRREEKRRQHGVAEDRHRCQ